MQCHFSNAFMMNELVFQEHILSFPAISHYQSSFDFTEHGLAGIRRVLGMVFSIKFAET